ncbi:MAG: asparaginase [Thiobacillus sp.]|uniref:asparaginase n=1 Tax=Thiobacillus sp. TaxID=924 RepID=UPI0027352891|nr:asparaginase [Thiobacillus sp.]MDP3584212.1 asparaginase [Thiobacillus sp.]
MPQSAPADHPNLPARTLVVLGTGGTIAGRASAVGDNVGYTAGEVGVGHLLAGVQGMAAQLHTLSGWVFEAEQVAQVDSKDMGPAVWRSLLARVAHHLVRPEVAGLVVTHGTDTLEETAWLLQAVLAPAKPVVMACAMRPATALVPDGPQNLMDALCVAATPGARGVVAVCAGQVHQAGHVQKVHTYRLDAFDSGDAGPLGCVEEGRLRAWQPWPEGTADRPLFQRLLATTAWPRVELITSHAGADGAVVRALLAASLPSAPLRGLVVAGTGNGTLHADLLTALADAQAAGVVVRRGTRCAYGQVVPGPHDALADTGGLSPVKARLALVLELLAADPC